MSNIPADLKYTRTHEWVRLDDDGNITVGISEHAQDQLGDMVYVEVPEVGREVEAEEACAVVESVKAASDVYAPIAGEVIEANADLGDRPETVNQDAFGEGWLFRLAPANVNDLDALLDADAYSDFLEAEEH